MKNNSMRNTTIITTIICIIPVIVGAILYSRLPDVIATHWDMNGTSNGWSSKFVGAIVFPGILVIINLLFPVILKADPKYENMSTKLRTLIQWIIPLVSVFCSSTTLAAALDKPANIGMVAPMLLGVIFIAIGNYLPKTNQSFTVGIRIPWTLNSEENWNRTHRLAGFLWVIGGIAMIVVGVVGVQFISIAAIVVLIAIIPTVYSYMIYKKGI